MVKRYLNDGDWIDPNGTTVQYEDYLSLQAALREALDRWHGGSGASGPSEDEYRRIAELRKQFLDI